MTSLRINYIAPADQTGYASAARQYIKALCSAGVPVHFQPMLPGRSLGLAYECAGSHAIRENLRATCAPSLFPDGLTILHCVPEYYAPLAAWIRARGVTGPIAGMTVWETTRIPRHWPGLLKPLAALFVPSEWNREVFLRSGVDCPILTVAHLPEFHGVAASADSVRAVHSRIATSANRFLFYSIGTWSARKGNDLLVRAFLQAFADRADVTLMLKTPSVRPSPPGSLLRKAAYILRRYPMDHARHVAMRSANIVVVEEDWPAEDIAALHATGDCYVSCARGEGWGFGMYEAAFFGNPVLCPKEGGHRAYLPQQAEYGFLPGAWQQIPLRDRDESYTAEQQWVETDVAALADRMVDCVAHRDRYKAQAGAVRDHVQREFAIDTITRDFIEGIRSIAGR